jgi:hypothetical protein
MTITPTTTLRVDFISESAGYKNVFGWYNKLTGFGGILFQNVEQEGRKAPLVAGHSSVNFSVNTADIGNIEYFLVSDGFSLNRNKPEKLSGPIKVVQLTDGSWGVADVDSNGNVITKNGKPDILSGRAANALFTETSKNAGGVDYASSRVGSNQTSATLAGDTSDGLAGLIAWEDLAATRNKNGSYGRPGDADYNDAVFRVSIVNPPSNLAPLVGPVTLQPVAEDSAYVINASVLLANSSDPENQTLSIASLLVQSGGGTLASNGNGTWSYTPAANYSGPVAFAFSVTDGTNTTVGGVASLQVTPVNDAPVVANAIADQSSAEDTAWSFVVPANAFADVDSATLTYSATLDNDAALPGWLSFNAATRTFSGTPPLNFNGAVDLKVTASDGSLSVSDTFTVNITPVNDAPVVSNAIADQSSAEDAAWSFVVPANAFADVDSATLTYSATLGNDAALPGWLSFNAATRTFSGTPPLNFNGAIDLKVTASDGSLSVSDTFTVNITPVNDAPVVSNAIADQSSAEDAAWSFVVPANAFADVDSATLTYSATLDNDAALPGWLSFNAATRTFSGTPPLNFNGALDLKVTASDGSLSVSDTFTVNITPVNDAPVVSNAIADQSSAEGRRPGASWFRRTRSPTSTVQRSPTRRRWATTQRCRAGSASTPPPAPSPARRR